MPKYKRHYTYIHKKLNTNEIFYIGIGTRGKTEQNSDKPSRAYNKSKRNSLWKNIVNKYGRSVEIVFESDNYEEVKNKEKELIQLYGRRDLNKGILINFTDGGDGNLNWKPSDEWKNNIKEIITRGYLEKKRRKINKKVFQYSLEGKFIKEWESITEASIFINCSLSTIQKGKNQAKGFQWRYEYLGEQIESTKYGKPHNYKGVTMLDLDGNELLKFNTIADAARYLNKDVASGTGISRACRHNKTIYGFKWRYNS